MISVHVSLFEYYLNDVYCRKEMDLLSSSSTKASSSNSNSNTNTNTTMKVLEAAVIIEQVYNKSLKLDQIIDDLPVILSRLRTLQQVHSESCSYSTRLNILEELLGSYNKDILGNKEVLNVLTQEMKDNMVTFDNNIQQVL